LRDRLAEVTDDLARARARLQAQPEEGSGSRPDRLPMVRSQSVVVWQPGPRRPRERPED
jgi:MerR family transcriptional regulator/heat shock protein HspR